MRRLNFGLGAIALAVASNFLSGNGNRGKPLYVKISTTSKPAFHCVSAFPLQCSDAADFLCTVTIEIDTEPGNTKVTGGRNTTTCLEMRNETYLERHFNPSETVYDVADLGSP